MVTRTAPKPPKHLKAATRRWFAGVVESYELEPHHERLLIAAADAWDRMDAARQVITRDGLTYTDRFGCPKARPEVAIERDARVAFARLVRELRLDVEPDDPRPPGLGGG